MNRRDFLKLLGLGAVTVATPKFIFDYGANLYTREPILIDPDDYIYNLTNSGIIFKKEYLRLAKNIYNQGHPMIRALNLNYSIGEAVVVPIKY